MLSKRERERLAVAGSLRLETPSLICHAEQARTMRSERWRGAQHDKLHRRRARRSKAVLKSVMLSKPERRGASKGASKHPEKASFTMPRQGVSTRNAHPYDPTAAEKSPLNKLQSPLNFVRFFKTLRCFVASAFAARL